MSSYHEDEDLAEGLGEFASFFKLKPSNPGVPKTVEKGEKKRIQSDKKMRKSYFEMEDELVDTSVYERSYLNLNGNEVDDYCLERSQYVDQDVMFEDPVSDTEDMGQGKVTKKKTEEEDLRNHWKLTNTRCTMSILSLNSSSKFVSSLNCGMVATKTFIGQTEN
ncbi:unnamed protein product [Caenorhabditis brenneri]